MNILSLREFHAFLEGEYIIHSYRRHPVVFVFKIFRNLVSYLLFFIVLIYFLIYPRFFMNVLSFSQQSVQINIIIIIGFIFLYMFFRVLYIYIDYRYDKLLITNKRVIDIDQHFIFGNDIKAILIHDIVNINTSQMGVWQAIFQYGSITIETSAGAEHDCQIHSLRNTEQIIKIIQDIRNKYDNGWKLRH